MGFPGLNLPQQIQANPGPRGGGMGPNPTALNRKPKVTQIAEGLQQMMQGLMTSSLAKQKHAGDWLDNKMIEISNGLDPNPDWKMIAKMAKASNRGYNTDVTPAQAQYQSVLNKQQNQGAMSQSPGFAAFLSAGAPAPGVGAPPAPPAAAAPGFMGRLRMMMGGSPRGPNAANVAQPSAASPFIQNLQALNAARQSQGGVPAEVKQTLQNGVLARNLAAAESKLGISQREAMLPVYSDMFQKALGGDLNAMTMMRRLDVMKGVPVDELGQLYKLEKPGSSDFEANSQAAKLLLWQQGGGPALQLRIADLAKDMIPRFGGDAGKAMQYTMGLYSNQETGLHPGLTAQELDQKSGAEVKLSERYPAAPVGLLKMEADAEMTGNKSLGDNILDFLNAHYKTAGEIQQSQFQQNLSKDYTQIASQNEIGNREADNGQLRFYNDSIETLLKNTGYDDIMKNPGGYTQAQKDATAGRVNDLVNSLAGTIINIGGKKQQLAPYQDLATRNNVSNPWYNALPGVASQGPIRQGSMNPSFTSVPAAPPSLTNPNPITGGQTFSPPGQLPTSPGGGNNQQILQQMLTQGMVGAANPGQTPPQ